MNRFFIQVKRFKARMPADTTATKALSWCVQRFLYTTNPFTFEMMWDWCGKTRYRPGNKRFFDQFRQIRAHEGLLGIFKGLPLMLACDSLDDIGRLMPVARQPWYYRAGIALGLAVLKQPLNMALTRMATETTPQYATFPRALAAVLREGPSVFLQGLDLNLFTSAIDYNCGSWSVLIYLFSQKPHIRCLTEDAAHRGFFAGTKTFLQIWRDEGFWSLGAPYTSFLKMLGWMFIPGGLAYIFSNMFPLKSDQLVNDVSVVKEMLESEPKPTLIHCAACNQTFTGVIHGLPGSFAAVCSHCGTNITIREE